MKYIVPIIILVILFGLYCVIYLYNSKVEKPKNCKDIECNGCNLNCHKRSDK